MNRGSSSVDDSSDNLDGKNGGNLGLLSGGGGVRPKTSEILVRSPDLSSTNLTNKKQQNQTATSLSSTLIN